MVWPKQVKLISNSERKVQPTKRTGQRLKFAVKKNNQTIISVVMSTDAVIFHFVAVPPCSVSRLHQWSWPTKTVTLTADAVCIQVSAVTQIGEHSLIHIKNKSCVMAHHRRSYILTCTDDVCLLRAFPWGMSTLPLRMKTGRQAEESLPSVTPEGFGYAKNWFLKSTAEEN